MSKLPYPGGSTSPGAELWTTIEVSGSGLEFSRPVRARVDTDSTYTWIPRDWLDSVGLMPDHEIPFEHSDGRKVTYPHGWLQIRVDGRELMSLVIFAPVDSEPFFWSVTLTSYIYALSLHDALPTSVWRGN